MCVDWIILCSRILVIDLTNARFADRVSQKLRRSNNICGATRKRVRVFTTFAVTGIDQSTRAVRM